MDESAKKGLEIDVTKETPSVTPRAAVNRGIQRDMAQNKSHRNPYKSASVCESYKQSYSVESLTREKQHFRVMQGFGDTPRGCRAALTCCP